MYWIVTTYNSKDGCKNRLFDKEDVAIATYIELKNSKEYSEVKIYQGKELDI